MIESRYLTKPGEIEELIEYLRSGMLHALEHKKYVRYIAAENCKDYDVPSVRPRGWIVTLVVNAP